MDPHAAFLMQRGLKTYYLRYESQTASAQKVAEFLAGHPAVGRVHYPGLPQHPRHALARKQMRDFGTVVAFDLLAGGTAGDRLADTLKLFSIAASMGSPESLIIPPGLLGPRELPPALEAASGIAAGTVRLAMGLDDPEDLIADLAEALESIRA